MLLMIDNYDSFVYNLVQYFGELGEEVKVFRNDAITVKNTTVSRQMATKAMELSTSRSVPDWLSLNKEEFKGVVMRIPTREEINPIANEQAVVEFYSR